MLFADAVFNIFIGVFDVRIVFNVFSVMFAKTSLFFCVVLYGVMICFGSLERDYSLSTGDMTFKKGLRSQHGKNVQLHNSLRWPRPVNQLRKLALTTCDCL